MPNNTNQTTLRHRVGLPQKACICMHLSTLAPRASHSHLAFLTSHLRPQQPPSPLGLENFAASLSLVASLTVVAAKGCLPDKMSGFCEPLAKIHHICEEPLRAARRRASREQLLSRSHTRTAANSNCWCARASATAVAPFLRLKTMHDETCFNRSTFCSEF